MVPFWQKQVNMEQEKEGCSGCGQTLETIQNMNVNFAESQKVPCSGCAGNRFGGKLGTCRMCIASNMIGSVFGWILFLVFSFLFQWRNAAYGALIFASLFTLLLSAHGVAYLIKKNKKASS